MKEGRCLPRLMLRAVLEGFLGPKKRQHAFSYCLCTGFVTIKGFLFCSSPPPPRSAGKGAWVLPGLQIGSRNHAIDEDVPKHLCKCRSCEGGAILGRDLWF